MKVLILGDSFADPTWATNSYKGWPELLADDFEITNKAVAGSSTWWAYKNFEHHNTAYDYCVFVVSIPTRIYIEPLGRHVNSYTETPYKNITLEEVYYQFFYSQERESFFHNAIVNKLLTYNNILLVPAFAESIDSHIGWSLCHFSDTESEFYKKEKPIKNDTRRKCHMSKESNLVIYEKVKEAINNREKILKLSASDFVTPLDPKEYYWL